MKKSLSIIPALVLALSLTACDTSPETSGESTSDTSSGVSEPVSGDNSSQSSTTSDVPVPALTDLPRMDGSTSATPLEIGLRSGFQGISYNEAKELVSHTTTHESFKRLINGEVDLIFSVPISDEQKKMADEAGVKLFMEPVAREGFVFVVNGSNPIDSLTQDQLRKIYSGEITNWSQVGGNDEKIIPYQRNTDSGSQNYMTVFMGDTPLLPAQKEFTAVGMGGLMDAVAVYDNSAGAIGYSVYSYAAQMYANADKVKFIAVDGVEPSKATMADESYPLLSCTYMIYTDKSPESAKNFVEKALSDEGQKYVLDSGYLPVNGMEVPEKYLPYQAVGTGEPKPADFKPSDKYSNLWLAVRNSYFPGQAIIKKDKYFEFDFLKDTALQDRINSDVRAAMDRLRGYELPKDEAEYRERNSQNYDDCIDDMSIEAECRNGYLSIIIGYFDTYDKGIDCTPYFKVETLNYDLFSGKKIERYSDLFYEGEDFLTDVNKQFTINSAAFESDKKLDFYGILGEPRLFTIDGVILEPDNIYFSIAPILRYDDSFRFHSPVTQYRDMKSIVYDKYAYKYDNKVEDISYGNEWETAYLEEDGDIYLRYVGSPFHTEAEVKAQDEFWYDLQKRSWDSFREVIPEWHSNHLTIRMYKNGNCYTISHFSAAAGENPRGLFDADTLELITIEDLVGENWRDYLSDNSKDYTGTKTLICDWSDSLAEKGMVNIYCLGEGSKYLTLEVPAEKMNKRCYTPEGN